MKQFFANLVNKLNPAQPDIVNDFGENVTVSTTLYSNQKAYNTIEVVNRGVNLIVDSASSIEIDVGDSLEVSVPEIKIRKKRLNQLLNFSPNPFYGADVFKRNIFMDLLLEGDAFIYYDNAYIYNLPALNVEIITDKKTYIKEYKYADTSFKPSEIIHIQENSGESIFEGKSRLDAANRSVNTLYQMREFQRVFFENSAVPGLILKTPNPLSDRVKARKLQQWMSAYNPGRGGRRPAILDGEWSVESLSKYTFKELDFNESIKNYEDTILKCLGIPPILLDSGNNANISPNLRLFYVETILPLYQKYVQALEIYFGYDLVPVTQKVLALQPELRDLANYLTTLTNAGILTQNESRAELRKPPDSDPESDKLVKPANVAGSAKDPSVGGRPINSTDQGSNSNNKN